MSRSGNILLAVALLSSSTVFADPSSVGSDWELLSLPSSEPSPCNSAVEDFVIIDVTNTDLLWRDTIRRQGLPPIHRQHSEPLVEVAKIQSQFPKTFSERLATMDGLDKKFKNLSGTVVEGIATAGKVSGDVLLSYELALPAVTAAGSAAVGASYLFGPLHPPLAGALHGLGWSVQHITFVQSQVIPVAAVALYPAVTTATSALLSGLGTAAVLAGRTSQDLLSAAWTKMWASNTPPTPPSETSSADSTPFVSAPSTPHRSGAPTPSASGTSTPGSHTSERLNSLMGRNNVTAVNPDELSARLTALRDETTSGNTQPPAAPSAQSAAASLWNRVSNLWPF